MAKEFGDKIPYPADDENTPLGKFEGEDLTLKMPDGDKTSDITWLSVWCSQASMNFGDVSFEKFNLATESSIDPGPSPGSSGVPIHPLFGLIAFTFFFNFI